MSNPEIIAICVGAVLLVALSWIWMPRLIRRRREFPPQHRHRRGPSGLSVGPGNLFEFESPDPEWPSRVELEHRAASRSKEGRVPHANPNYRRRP